MIRASARSGSPELPVGWPSIGAGDSPGDDATGLGVDEGVGVGEGVGDGEGVGVGVGVGVDVGVAVGVAVGVGDGVGRGVGVGVGRGVLVGVAVGAGVGVGVSVASGVSVSAAGARVGMASEALGGRLGMFDRSPSGIDGRAEESGPPHAATATAKTTTAKGRAGTCPRRPRIRSPLPPVTWGSVTADSIGGVTRSG
jgi:hypothetical protein